MPRNYAMALAEGAVYYSYKEFQTALATFCRQTNSRFSVYDCKKIENFNSRKLNCDRLPLHLKYKYAKVACERFGQPRHEGRGIRNKGSKKNGCGAYVTLSAKKTLTEAFLIVLRMVTKHSSQCEMRRKQKRIKMALEGKEDPASVEPPIYDQNAAPNASYATDAGFASDASNASDATFVPDPSFEIKEEPLESDDDGMQEYNYDVKPVVVYSDDEEEQKPIPIFHLNEVQPPAESTESKQLPTQNDESASEDVKPLPLADKPSLRDFLLPAMALNFSQRVIDTET